MQFPAPSMVAVGDVRLAVYEEGSGPPVILVHGFPETAYSWRAQLPALAAAGYRAIAIDMRGYGSSDAPADLDAYRIDELVGDLVGLVDALALEKPVAIGHDWGSIVVQSAAVMDPAPFAAFGSFNVPYRGWCAGFPTTEYMGEYLSDRFGYVLWFHDGAKAEESFERDPRAFLLRFYEAAALHKGFLNEVDLDRFVDAFVATGITPALSYYRNIDANHALTEHLANATIDKPYLMAAADSDPVLPLGLVDGMERWVPDLRLKVIADSGHWVQQEQPEASTAAILEFLEEIV